MAISMGKDARGGMAARGTEDGRRMPSGLVLARDPQEGVEIDIPPGFTGRIRVFVSSIKGHTARLLFDVPRTVPILRCELSGQPAGPLPAA